MDHFNKLTDDPCSAIESTLTQGQIDSVKRLIEHGYEIDVKSVLKTAVTEQIPELLECLLANYDRELLESCVRNDNTLLFLSVRGGNLHIIGKLLDAGADINRPCNTGLPPLAESKNGEVAKLLLQRGADINMVTGNAFAFRKPLCHIFHRRQINDSDILEIVEVMFQNGASVNELSCCGATPLILAAFHKKCDRMVKLLLKYGADLSVRDSSGNTVLIQALRNLYCEGIVSDLLPFALDRTDLINAQNNTGLTALMCAVKHTWMINTLIERGADVNIQDKYGNTALFHAMFDRSFEAENTVARLISAGSDVNCQNNAGLSPLMVAAINFKKESLSILLDSGADVNAVSRKDNTSTALSCILNVPNYGEEGKQCIQLLLDKGGIFHCVNPVVLFNMILHSYTEVIPQLIQSGLSPAEINSDKIPLRVLRRVPSFSVSPLCMALLCGNVALARYFWGNMFLTSSDSSSLTFNKILRKILERKKYQQCLDFLDEISHRPLSLFAISLVAVSSAIATAPERENRVNMLPIPELMKDMLLFKPQNVSLISPASNMRTRSSYVGRISWDYSLLEGDVAFLKRVSTNPCVLQYPWVSNNGIWGVANRLI